MRKIVIFLIMLFSIFSYAFADDNTIELENINQNDRSQTNQKMYTNSQGNILSIFGTLLFWSGIVCVGSSMNRQEREVYNNRWEQQEKE